MKFKFLHVKHIAQIALLFFSSVTYSQVDWHLSGETGFFKASGDETLQKENTLSLFDGFLKYSYESEKRTASLSLRARPEFYGFSNAVNFIKLKTEGDYYQFEEKFNWGLNISRQVNFFKQQNDNLTYNVFTLTGSATWFYFDNMPVNTNLGYAYQVIKNNEEYNLDLLFFDCNLYNQLNTYLRLGYGLYAEKFFIKNTIEIMDTNSNHENNGWRFGPQLSLNYLKNFIINIDYKFLLQDSKFTKNFSYEHLIRIVTGKIFFTDWSAFLLVDYNTISLKKTSDYIEGITPLYTPLNYENRIYFKIAYELSNNFEIFTKAGYFKNNLYENKFSLEGWNVTLGIEISKGTD